MPITSNNVSFDSDYGGRIDSTLEDFFNWIPAHTTTEIAAMTGMAEGDVVVDSTLHELQVYLNSSWTACSGGGGATTFVGLTDTPANFTSAANKILKVNTGGDAVEFVTVSGDISIGATGTAAITAGSIINTDVKSDAAIAYSKLAALTSAKMLVGTSGNVAAAVTISGDISVGNTGIAAITADSIINADVKTDAAIAYSKLAALTTGSILLGVGDVATVTDIKTSGRILVGSGTTAASVAVSQDATLAANGALSVTGLTIASEAQGDVLYRNASDWVRLAPDSGKYLKSQGAGSNPVWATVTAGSASSIVSGATFECAGAFDAITAHTEQTVSAPTLTIPDFAGANDNFTFDTLAATLKNKGLDDASSFWGDTADMTKKVVWELSGAATGKTLTLDSNHTDNRTVLFPNTSCTLAGLQVAQEFTLDQTFQYGHLKLRDNDEGQSLQILLAENMTGDKTLTLQIGDTSRAITLGGDIALGGTLTTLAAWAQAGAHTIGITTTGATTITLPTTGTLASLGVAQDWTHDQTFNYGHLKLHDNDEGQALQVLLNENMTGDKTLTLQVNDTSRTINLGGNLVLGGTLTTTGAWTQVGAHTVGITTQANTTFAFADATVPALTFPTGTKTLVARDSVDTLTNKTYSCDGTGNVFTNLNADELVPITVNTDDYGVPFVIIADIVNAATTTIYNNNAPFKFRVIGVKCVSTVNGNGGTCTVKGDGAVAITDAMTVDVADKGIIIETEIDDASYEVPANGDLTIVSSNGTDDFNCYITCIRVV